MSNLKKSLIIVAMCFGTFMCLLNETIMNIVLPEIQMGLHTNLSSMTWAINVYTIMFAALTIPFGRLAERMGIHKTFIFGLIVFLIGAIFASVSSDINLLILGRGIQALGVSFVFPLSMLIGIETVDIKSRPRVIAMLAMTQGLAGALGPTIGGVISEYINWRWVFIINIPMVIITIILCLFTLNLKEKRNNSKVDIIGSLLSTIILVSLTLALVQGNDWHWNSLAIIGLFLISALSLVLFALYERRAKNPMIPMKLFTYRQYNGASLSILLSTVFFVGVLVVLPTYFVKIQNKSDLMAALLVTPASLMISFFSPISSILVKKLGGKISVSIGFLSMGISYILFWNINMNINWQVAIACAFVGIGYGIIVGSMQTLAAADFTGDLLSASQPVILVMRLIGFALAASIFITALNNNVNIAKSNSISFAKKEVDSLNLSSAQTNKFKNKITSRIKNEDNRITAKYKFSNDQKQLLLNQELNKIPSNIRNLTKPKIENTINKKIKNYESKINTSTEIIRKNTKKQFSNAFINIYKLATPFVFLLIFISFIFKRKKI